MKDERGEWMEATWSQLFQSGLWENAFFIVERLAQDNFTWREDFMTDSTRARYFYKYSEVERKWTTTKL